MKLDEASVKNLTGGDRITARRMREDPWEFNPTHSLWLQTNHLPEISGRDAGIWRRIRVIPWVRSFGGKIEETDLKERLETEASGILRWLVEGCLEWQREGLHEPEAVLQATLLYREREDVLSRFAKDTGLSFGVGLEMPAKEMQEMFAEWALADGLRPPAQELGDWLREKGATQARQRFSDTDGTRRQRRVWIGVGIEGGARRTVQSSNP